MVRSAGKASCQDYLSGFVTSIKDMEAFEDDKYTEAIITDRASWDSKRLPKRVTELEAKGYVCSPSALVYYPLSNPKASKMQIMPLVKTVQWQCSLEFEDAKYLASSDTAKKSALEKEGYSCNKVSCSGEDAKEDFVWMCAK
ncbi:MAG: hypothetical protein FJZ09_06515 [Candidatus Omnitrophica bacterium]|nr:hypothetical protein [Candidatus Omnitrophota bacterium]